MSSEAQVTIHIRDVNDESPVFTQSEYHVELLEHATKGTKVLQVQAIDKDTTGNYGKVTYSNLIGSNAFRLDPVTGDITVERPELIDRELEPGKQFKCKSTIKWPTFIGFDRYLHAHLLPFCAYITYINNTMAMLYNL